jgi:hypothetical protein
MVVTGTAFAVLLYLSLCNLYPLPLYHPICPEVDMRMYLMTNLSVMLIAALASANVIGNGLLSLVTLRADYDTPAAWRCWYHRPYGGGRCDRRLFVYGSRGGSICRPRHWGW